MNTAFYLFFGIIISLQLYMIWWLRRERQRSKEAAKVSLKVQLDGNEYLTGLRSRTTTQPSL